MPSVTRHKVFETNSSSTHSICITPGDFKPDTFYRTDNGTLRLLPGEFGWEQESYRDPWSKASYCLTYVKTGGDPDGSREAMLREVLEKEVGKVDFIPFGCDPIDGNDWGYIDHQSHIGHRDACGEAFKSKESLRAFIFNPNSILVTDNDNH